MLARASGIGRDAEAHEHVFQELTNRLEDAAQAGTVGRLRARILESWDPVAIEKDVLLTQARQKPAFNRNVCRDLGW